METRKEVGRKKKERDDDDDDDDDDDEAEEEEEEIFVHALWLFGRPTLYLIN